MTLEDITNNIDNKILINENIIKYTFFELRVALNYSEEEMYKFLYYAKLRLRNLNYTIYSSGQKYKIDNFVKTVKENELLIAIKK